MPSKGSFGSVGTGVTARNCLPVVPVPGRTTGVVGGKCALDELALVEVVGGFGVAASGFWKGVGVSLLDGIFTFPACVPQYSQTPNFLRQSKQCVALQLPHGWNTTPDVTL